MSTAPQPAAQLSACPFCGSSSVQLQSADAAYIACGSCLAEGPYFATGDNDEDTRMAIQAWNKRATVPTLSGEGRDDSFDLPKCGPGRW
jgi:Lar family restriction alleviation protein